MVPCCKHTKYWSIWWCNTNSDADLNFQKQTSKSKSKLTTFHFQHLIRFWSTLIKSRRNHIFELVGWGRNFPNLHRNEPKHQNCEVPYLAYFIRISSILSGFVVPLQIMMHDVRIYKRDQKKPPKTRRHFGSHVLTTPPPNNPTPKTCLH